MSTEDYLRRWRERETKVREWHDQTLMKYPRSVAVTWDTSVSQLETDMPPGQIRWPHVSINTLVKAP